MKNYYFNISGKHIAILRKASHPKMSQRQLAIAMQLFGINIHKNAISNIEMGKRAVSDIELCAFAKLFNVSVDRLLK